MDDTTRLAYDRTWLSYERTMQSWIRTATSLITFGFSVYKLADIAAARLGGNDRVLGPHEIGLAFVCLGFIFLGVATFEYRTNIRAIRAEYGKSRRSTSVWLAAIVTLVGILALASMFFNF